MPNQHIDIPTTPDGGSAQGLFGRAIEVLGSLANSVFGGTPPTPGEKKAARVARNDTSSAESRGDRTYATANTTITETITFEWERIPDIPDIPEH